MDEASSLTNVSARSSPKSGDSIEPRDCCECFEMHSGGFPLPGECWYRRCAWC